jgi:hypothetical protein
MEFWQTPAAVGARRTEQEEPHAMRRALASVALVLAAVTLVTGCGGDGQPSSTTSSASAQQAEDIDVTFKGDEVTPNGERVDVAAGQDVELHVTADAAGEIHVHSSPEQELEYKAGESTVTIKGITAPGTVDVESHALDKVIVQLEVR